MKRIGPPQKNRFRSGGLAVCVLLVVLPPVTAALWVRAVQGKIARLETQGERTGAPGRFVQAGDHFLHLRIFGADQETRPPLLLVHGFDIRGGAKWDPVARDLARDRLVLVPDLLGFGHSQRVRPARAVQDIQGS